MRATKGSWSELESGYQAALLSYIREGQENALQVAYELGREALDRGKGILDMVALHRRAIANLVFANERRMSGQAMLRAGEFLTEAVGSFEMTHRAFGDAQLALHELNVTLEAEARRFAQALHDESGQLLAAAHIKLNEIARGLPAHVRERLQEVRTLLDQVEVQLRQLSHELRPTALEELGLGPALESLAESVSQRTGVHVIAAVNPGENLSAAVKSAIYRVVQEALSNVAKHSGARNAEVRVERMAGEIVGSVSDDGRGFDAPALAAGTGGGLGFLGMRERLLSLAGELEIRSAPGEGTAIRFQIPIEV